MDGITTDRAILAVPVELPGVMGKLEATRRELARHQRWLKLARLLLAEIMLCSAFVFADWMWVLPVALRGFGAPGDAAGWVRSCSCDRAVRSIARPRRPASRPISPSSGSESAPWSNTPNPRRIPSPRRPV